MITQPAQKLSSNGHTKPKGKPRLGFLGVGWIGRNRLQSITDAGVADIIAMTEPSNEMAAAAQQIAPDAKLIMSFDELMSADLDGVVIATPSAMHAEQAIAAMEKGLAVFCQKPLARNASETWRVVDAARKADKLIGVDFSYRYIDGVDEIKNLVRSEEIGEVFAVDLVFHNAYGPDKEWFYHPELSGGGCLIDLGTHLVDLAMWVLEWPPVANVNARLYSGGKTVADRSTQVEDYAAAQFELDRDINGRLVCSWNLNAGREAVIEATFYGTKGAASLRNENGSFFEFSTHLMRGTATTRIDNPERESFDWDWGGRAAVEWVKRLAESPKFDTSAADLISVAEVIDTIYASAVMNSQALAK